MKYRNGFAGGVGAALSAFGLVVSLLLGGAAGAQEMQKSEAAAPPKKISVSTTVYFDPGRSELTADARAKIDDMLAKLAGLKIETVNATGIAGRMHSEVPLALARVDLVRDYLASKGIVPSSFRREAEEEYPLPNQADGRETPEERKHQSRVEIELSGYRPAAQ
jgi:outer membrane protein OmpA-like peptidoglycan-associated protein